MMQTRTEMNLGPRFLRLAAIWALALASLWVGERLYRDYALSADEPRMVATEGRLSDWEKSTIELFRTAAPSVAYITTERLRFNPFLGFAFAQGAGSGFVWDRAGHIVTNYHVVDGADTVYVQLDGGEPIEARVVGGAQDYDIAVVRLSIPPAGSSAGVGFAIPVDLVNRVVPQIIKNGRAPRPGIGIVAADERIAARLGVRGVIVLGVSPGSPAEGAGVRPFNRATGELGDSSSR
jgi:S1-C subfamily serine protease